MSRKGVNIHEYQGKALFREEGVAVQEGVHCTTVDQALEAYDSLGSKIVAVKSQIHAGGRGKGNLYCPDTGDLQMEGGVKIALSRDEVETYSKNILGNILVTKQSGPEGKMVNNLYIEAGCEIAHEYYLALLVDREEDAILVMASTEGGVDIEEVAEINPLVRAGDGAMIALDSKISFDDNASFRHPWRAEMRDMSEEEEVEIRANKSGLSYVKLDGNIGCLVNGAGLAMASMDVIKLYGGEPANFLDIGGGANKESITTAFGIILEDPNVEGILVNIFGGIIRCDMVARSIIDASREVGLSVPLVVRFSGTNHEEGRDVLEESSLEVTTVGTLADGAEAIVAATVGVDA